MHHGHFDLVQMLEGHRTIFWEVLDAQAASPWNHVVSNETPSLDFPVVCCAVGETDVAFFIDIPAIREPAGIDVLDHKSLVAKRLIWRRCWCLWLWFIWLALLMMSVSPWGEADCLLSVEPQSLLLDSLWYETAAVEGSSAGCDCVACGVGAAVGIAGSSLGSEMEIPDRGDTSPAGMGIWAPSGCT